MNIVLSTRNPTIIFVHGLGLSGEAWAPQQEWCRQHNIESVALTLPGHGSRRDEVASVEGMADEIIATASRFEKVVLVGHSFGAFLCVLAAPKIQNIQEVIFINPLLDATQMRGLFLASVKIAKVIQRFLSMTKHPGEFANGTRWFWRWGIYPYCLVCNSMNTIQKLCQKIKKLGRISLPSHVRRTILLSRNDELIKSVNHEKGITIPVSGHMLFRLAPEAVNRLLAQAVLRPEEHRV